MDDLILVGAGGHARSCIDVIEQNKMFRIVGLVDKNVNPGGRVFGYPVVGNDEMLEVVRATCGSAIVTIGQIRNSDNRVILYQKIRALEFILPTIVSPSAYVSRNSTVGSGTIVMHNAQVSIGSTIGNNCIVNSCALIDHDSTVGDHCHISTGAILNGQVEVGERCFIGSGAIIKQSVAIGDNCVIGSGVMVKRNVKPNSVLRYHE